MPPKPKPEVNWVNPKKCKVCGAKVTKQYHHTIDKWGHRHYYPLCVEHFREMKNRQYASLRARKLGAPAPISAGDLCQICGKRARVMDHSHITGKWRGHLCYKCNSGLGAFGDSTERIESAIAYLKRYAVEVR